MSHFLSPNSGNHKTTISSRGMDTPHTSLQVKVTQFRIFLEGTLMSKAISILRHIQRQSPWMGSKKCHGIMTLASTRIHWQAWQTTYHMELVSHMLLRQIACPVPSLRSYPAQWHLNSISSWRNPHQDTSILQVRLHKTQEAHSNSRHGLWFSR